MGCGGKYENVRKRRAYDVTCQLNFQGQRGCTLDKYLLILVVRGPENVGARTNIGEIRMRSHSGTRQALTSDSLNGDVPMRIARCRYQTPSKQNQREQFMQGQIRGSDQKKFYELIGETRFASLLVSQGYMLKRYLIVE